MSEGYLRHLLSEEIADLEMNGCTADNWENIKVASPFHAEHVCNCLLYTSDAADE